VYVPQYYLRTQAKKREWSTLLSKESWGMLPQGNFLNDPFEIKICIMFMNAGVYKENKWL